jgi:hypothetical protein
MTSEFGVVITVRGLSRFSPTAMTLYPVPAISPRPTFIEYMLIAGSAHR